MRTHLLRLLNWDDFDDVLVPAELRLECSLNLDVVFHEVDIDCITSYKHYALPPHDGIVQEEDDEHDQI